MRFSWVFALLLGFISNGWAQGRYQKARAPLEAQVVQPTVLWTRPSQPARSVAALSLNDSLIVLGRQGNWLQAVFQGKTGWIQAGYVRIVGLAAAPSTTPETVAPSEPSLSLPPMPPAAPKRSTTKPSRSIRKHPITVSSHFAKGIKSMENAFRIQGGYGVYAWSKTNGLDVFFGVGFKGATLIYGGPRFVYDVGVKALGGRLHLLTSLPVYSVSESGSSDLAIGTQTALELRYPLGRQQARFVFTVPFEAILYGAERTRISVLPGIGLVF